MDNRQYLTNLGITDPETREQCLARMEAYGENRWWEPGVDPRTHAYYQFKTPFLLGSQDRFHESIALLLDRPVLMSELALNSETLVQEVENAWSGLGQRISGAERQQRVSAATDQLYGWARKNKKRVIEGRFAEGMLKSTRDLLLAFTLFGLVIGLVLTVGVYGQGYGYWRFIFWEGMVAYIPLGLCLGTWHGWLVSRQWSIGPKILLAVISDITLTLCIAMAEDILIGNASWQESWAAAQIALQNTWIEGAFLVLLLCLLIVNGHRSSSFPGKKSRKAPR